MSARTGQRAHRRMDGRCSDSARVPVALSSAVAFDYARSSGGLRVGANRRVTFEQGTGAGRSEGADKKKTRRPRTRLILCAPSYLRPLSRRALSWPTRWPPSPARLFQALVAGAAEGAALAEEDCAHSVAGGAQAPVIAAPPMRAGQALQDLCAEQRSRRGRRRSAPCRRNQGAQIHQAAPVRCRNTLLYPWRFDDEANAQDMHGISTIAERLYQFGRGVDMAWAWAEIIDADAAEARLAEEVGTVHRPGDVGGAALVSPSRGLSRASEAAQKTRGRFTRFTNPSRPRRRRPAKVVGEVFSQAPMPRFRHVSYGSPTDSFLFEFIGKRRRGASPAVTLMECLRDRRAEARKEAGGQGW